MKPLLSTIVFLAAISAAAAQSTPSSPAPISRQKAKALAIFAPPPRYPTDERGRRPTGRGIVVVEVDQKTGWVTSAKMDRSTGNKLLDDAALEAFRQWRFRPGTARRFPSLSGGERSLGSNKAMQPTAGRRTVSRQFMNALLQIFTRAVASGG